MDRLNNRSKIVTIILVWLIPATIFGLALHYDWLKVWNALSIHSVAPPFLDLRSVPAGLRTLRQGRDPLVVNPSDQFHRPLNYPRIWLYAFGLLGVNEQNVWIVGLLFAALYLLCISKIILDTQFPREQLILLLISLSIGPLFALERGNTDVLIFAIVFAGSRLSRASQRAGIFLIAMLLKLFPLAILVVDAVRQPGRNRLWPLGAIGLGMVLLAAQWRDLILIQQGTPIVACASYGMLSLKETLFLFFMGHGLFGSDADVIAWAAVVCCLLGSLLLAAWAWKRSNRFDSSVLQTRAGDLFFVFGAIYAATFVIGSNWDYRLIFLVPTAPFALELMRSRAHFWGLSYIVCLLFVENCIAFEGGYKSLSAQAATFLLFFLVITILVEQVKSYCVSADTSVLAMETGLPELEAR